MHDYLRLNFRRCDIIIDGDNMKLIYATKNKSKLNHMSKMLEGTSFEVIGLNEIEKELIEPIEDGITPLENATKKALGYYNQLKKPVYSTDSALYFENVDDEDQPGVFIKRINGKNLKGKDFQKHYIEIAKKYGGLIKAKYMNAICVVFNENKIRQYSEEDIHSEEFYIVSDPHPYFEEGFPLNSLSVHIETGKYYNDMKDYKAKGSMDEGFRKFFKSIDN